MKKQLLVTVEYPEDTTANVFTDIAIKSVLNDINADCEEGWSVSYTDIPKAIQIKELALAVALRYHLSDFDGDKTSDETFSAIGESEDIVVWEPFERWESYEITNSVWNLAHDIETTFNEALGLEESE
jgi:hypothetical protein